MMLTLPLLMGVFVFVPQTVHGQAFEIPNEGAAGCKATGNCQLNDAVNTLISVAEFIFGISGSLALFMFMYGGFVWVTSGGSDTRIAKGREIIQQATVGLLIVFMSAAIVQFAVGALGVDGSFNFLKGKQGETIEQKI